MKCPQCQKDNPPQSIFCPACGERLKLACDACGAELPPGSRFCNQCGTRVQTSAASHRWSGSPDAYTPKYLAEKIMTSKSALEGERKHVTVLFADLKGSMELLADQDPEEARKLLDPVLERMMEAVHHYEGTVNQVMGDGIMALFGAPVSHEDHAVRACYAALRMQRSINLFADKYERNDDARVQIRVGLNSGEVVVRAIGSDLQMDYTAVGQTTHLAARMEQTADPGAIVLTGDTLKLAEGYVQVRPLGPVTVKGLENSTEVYELAGVDPIRSRLRASARRGLTRFVGRQRELQQLCMTLEYVAAGRGQAVAIVGEAGIGKSRIVWEFAQSHCTDEWLVLESGSVPYGRSMPYLPIIELLRKYLKIEEDDDQDIGNRVADHLRTLDRNLEPEMTPLLALLDVPFDDDVWETLDPPQRRMRILEAVKRLIFRQSQARPLVLIFEDLHWMDSESQALLDSIIEGLPGLRILLLVSFRPEYRRAWADKTYYSQLRINPLSVTSAKKLLTTLLGQDQSLAPLKRVLIERNEGNPLFLEENIRNLVESNILVGDRGAYRMTRAPESWSIPDTAQAVLAARIDRLPPDDKRLLQAASVIGRDVSFNLLQAIADVSENSLLQGIGHLRKAEFLYESSLFPELEYGFNHALTQEVAYASILQDRRRSLHARIVEAIETLYPDRLAGQIESLAHHAFQGKVWEKAVVYLKQAGAKDLARSAYREAATCFERAMEALHQMPDTRLKIERAIDLRLDLRQALFPMGEFEKIWGYLRDAEHLAETLDDPQRLGWVSAYMCGHLVHTGGRVSEVRTLALRVKDIAESLGDDQLLVASQYYLAAAFHLSGDYRGAEKVCRDLIAFLQEQQPREQSGLIVHPVFWSRVKLARVLAERGLFDEGETHGQEAIRIAESLEHPLSILVGSLYLAYLKSVKGEPSQAEPLLERAVDQCREWGLTSHTPIVMASLGHVTALSGRVQEGISCLQQALADYERAGIGYYHSLSMKQLGEAYLLAGQIQNARDCADRAVMLARERGERGYEAWSLHLLGEIASHPGGLDAAAAENHYDAAKTLAAELEMRPLVAHCNFGLGKLARRMGKSKEAQKCLTTAIEMYDRMDMHRWVKKSESALNKMD